LNLVQKPSLKRRDILRGAVEIKEVLGARPFYTKKLCVHFMPGNDAKVAFFVPGRLGTAVVRNKAKRRMREIYRKSREAFPKGRTIFRLKETAVWEELLGDFAYAARKLRDHNV
jgi:ribonuclease P protein component